MGPVLTLERAQQREERRRLGTPLLVWILKPPLFNCWGVQRTQRRDARKALSLEPGFLSVLFN